MLKDWVTSRLLEQKTQKYMSRRLSYVVNYVISLSGGKDSTAVAHMFLDKGIRIHSLVFFDTDWEFPEMHDHLDLFEEKTGIKIIRLKPQIPFNDWMFNRHMVGRTGVFKGRLKQIGNGWPSMSRRWCTREKVREIQRYQKTIQRVVPCVGYAADETGRERKRDICYPLDHFGMTEADCLDYCKSIGYHWGGLYEIFDRVSCFCCPLQGKTNLKLLRENRPALYDKTYTWDLMQPRHNQGFIGYESVQQIEEQWVIEETIKADQVTEFWFNKEAAQQRLF